MPGNGPAIPAIALLLLLAACGQGDSANVPGDTGDETAFSEIAEDAVINLAGTEPFWNGRIARGTFTYTTPDNMDGTRVPVTRFAGRGGLSFSGQMDGRQLDIAITPAACSDGMSDRSYPFFATLQIGDEQREGCAWRDGDDLGEPETGAP